MEKEAIIRNAQNAELATTSSFKFKQLKLLLWICNSALMFRFCQVRAVEIVVVGMRLCTCVPFPLIHASKSVWPATDLQCKKMKWTLWRRVEGTNRQPCKYSSPQP